MGRGASTNSIPEIENARFLLVIGSNTTEAHPVLALRIKKAVRNGATLVVAESAMRRLVGFDLDADGTLSNRRDWATLPEGDYPDGICIDAEDAVWIAGPASDRFVRVAEGGDVLDMVETPGRHAIACALGRVRQSVNSYWMTPIVSSLISLRPRGCSPARA